jgi:hypothetical protein
VDEKIDAALTNTLAMIRANAKPEDMLKLAQAALYLAQTKQAMVAVAGKK